MATTKAFELAQLSAGVTSTTGVASLADALNVNGSEILVGTNDSRFAENNLRFMATGASYIDVNTVGQALNFRVSETSSLDTTAISIASDGKVTLPTLTGETAIDTGSLTLDGGRNIQWGGAFGAGFPTVWGHSANKQIKFAPDGTTSGLLYQMSVTQLEVNPTTTSTSTSSGALVVAGGAGIAENLYVGGNTVISGDLTVAGTSVTLNTTDLNVEDKNITLNYHASNDTSASAGGAGITIQDAVDASNDASILWNATNDEFDFSHAITVPSTLTLTSNAPRIFLYEADTTDLNTALFSSGGKFTIRTTTDDDATRTTRLEVDHNNGNISSYNAAGTDVKLFWDASAESLSIGVTGSSTDRRFQISSTSPQTATTQYGIVANPTMSNDVTGSIYNIYSQANVASGATLTNLYSVYVGAAGLNSSTVTNVYGIYQAGTSDKNYFAGKIGIGGTNAISTDPQWDLVVGSNNSVGTNGQIFVDATVNGTGDGITIDGDGRTIGDGALFLIIDKDNNTGMSVGTDGNVGIGTASSTTVKLDVNDDGVTDNAWNTLAKFRPDLNDAHAETSIHIQSYPSTTVVADRKAGIQSIDDAGNARPLMLNKDGGIVVIGSGATGWAEMHLDGASGGDLILKDNGVSYGEVYAGNGHGLVIKSYASQDIYFLTNANATPKMVIESGGNVGIGADPALHKLDVDGAIATRQVRHSVRPSLNLDFANTKEIDDRISFYRNSVGTYYDTKGIMKYATVNQPRFDHDPLTKEPKGLLIETNAQNDIHTPHDFTTSSWARAAGADLFIYPNSGVAPDGTMSATKIVPGGISTRKTIYRNPGMASGWNTFSVFAKAGGYSNIVIGAHNGSNSSGCSHRVSLVTGAYTDQAVQSITTHTHAEELSDGWWRISVSFNNTNGCTSLVLGIYDATDISTYEPNYRSNIGVGDGTKGVYLWGAQLERTPYLTSFIQPVSEFTDRTTAATYHNEDGILVESPKDEHRHGYAWNGRKWIPTGFILEAQSSTNLFPQTNIDFDGSWIEQSSSNLTPFYNSFTSPDGSQGTAALLTTSSTSGNVVYRNATAISNSSNKYTFSMYAKANGTDILELRFDFPALKKATFDLTNGTVTYATDQANYPGVMTYAGDGWWRCSISSNVNAQITNVVFSGNVAVASNDILVWGAQLETGSEPTSFIYTNATRAADVYYASDAYREPDYARIPVNDWYNYDEGTLMVNAINGTRVGYGPRVAYLSNGSSTQRIGMYVSGSGTLRLLINDNGTSVDTISTINYGDYGDSFKFAGSWKQADADAIDNGAITGSTSSGITIPQDVTHLNIGGYYESNPDGVIHIKKLEYYKEKVADATLQALTENN